jgi:23S rRNA (guanosine2251-2'-O)-methyltransferase
MSETWIVGINPVEGALANDPDRVREVVIEQNSKNARINEIASQARKLGLVLKMVSKEQLEKLGGEARHQGVIARYETPPLRDE